MYKVQNVVIRCLQVASNIKTCICVNLFSISYYIVYTFGLHQHKIVKFYILDYHGFISISVFVSDLGILFSLL